MSNRVKKIMDSSQNLNYTGDIHIQVLNDNRIYYDRYLHNHGMPKLFKFIVTCLSGNFSNAKSEIPCKIILFKKLDTEIFPSEVNENNQETIIWSLETKVSDAIYYDSTATPDISDNGGSIEYHFRIPFLALTSGVTVKKIGLDPNLITDTDYKQDLYAYYLFDKIGNETDPGIVIPADGSNYTIIINWKLTINNAA